MYTGICNWLIHPETLSTLQTLSSPYPILALIGPAGSLKRQLSRMLIEKAKNYFAVLKSHTDSPDWWKWDRNARETGYHEVHSNFHEEKSFSNKNFIHLSVEADVGLSEKAVEIGISEYDHEHITSDEFDKLRSDGEFIQTALVGGEYLWVTKQKCS